MIKYFVISSISYQSNEVKIYDDESEAQKAYEHNIPRFPKNI